MSDKTIKDDLLLSIDDLDVNLDQEGEEVGEHIKSYLSSELEGFYNHTSNEVKKYVKVLFEEEKDDTMKRISKAFYPYILLFLGAFLGVLLVKMKR